MRPPGLRSYRHSQPVSSPKELPPGPERRSVHDASALDVQQRLPRTKRWIQSSWRRSRTPTDRTVKNCPLEEVVDRELADGYHISKSGRATARVEMRAETTAKPVGARCWSLGPAKKPRRAFTLIELLVVISIISLLMAMLVPVLGKVRCQARALVGMGNLRQIAQAVNCYAWDNDESYPPSTATIGFADHWNWQEPTMLTGYRKRSPQLHRSMSAYLHRYVEDASVMFCPNAPKKYTYLQQAWDAGDEWDHPETAPMPDALIGVYCFYWNYTGYLGRGRGLFRGPNGPSRGHGRSKLLVSDYFGYDHWRSPNAYGSCEKFRGANVTEGTWISSAYWSRSASGNTVDLDTLAIELHAGYIDGHVECYSASDTVPIKVILNRETNEPYPPGLGPGDFYLPRSALR